MRSFWHAFAKNRLAVAGGIAVLTLVANLLADVAYGLVDPRIRLGGRGRR